MIVDRRLHLLGAMLAVNVVKGLFMLAAAFAVMGLVRQLSAETRHVIWF